MNLERPTFKDILAARQIISRYLPKTPLYNYPQLDQLLDTKVYVKHENHMPTGAFKVRGGINLISHLTSEQRERGVVTASTGNHAQSIAYACALHGVPATIVMPEGANPVKVKAVRGFGAAGCCLVKEAVYPSAQVIAVQAERAPAAYLSWKTRKIVKDRVETAAEGLATQVGYELTQEILWDHLSDFILVSEDEMKQAILTYLELVRNLTEEAGAAPLAAALKIKERLKGEKIALILSGGNISLERLKTVLSLKTN